MVGPEFISMAAGEAENPRRLMGKAFSSFVWRLMFFFIGGALCVGIVIPYDDQMLADVISGDREGSGTGAAYVFHSKINVSRRPRTRKLTCNETGPPT
jgi:amino acid transporter